MWTLMESTCKKRHALNGARLRTLQEEEGATVCRSLVTYGLSSPDILVVDDGDGLHLRLPNYACLRTRNLYPVLEGLRTIATPYSVVGYLNLVVSEPGGIVSIAIEPTHRAAFTFAVAVAIVYGIQSFTIGIKESDDY